MTEVAENQPEMLQKRILLSFCATVLVGVVLCGAYLAGRPRAKADVSASPVQVVAQANLQGSGQASLLPVATAAATAVVPPPAGEAVIIDASAPRVDPAPTPRAEPVHAIAPVSTPAPTPVSAPAPAAVPDVPVRVADASTLNENDTYLQMAAVDRGMAEVLVEVLHRKGISAIIVPGPTEQIFRVLVGPVNDATSMARLKAELDAAGFPSFARKVRS